MSVNPTIYWQYILKRPIFHPYLIHFHCQIQGIKSFWNVKQAASLVCGKPWKNVYATCQQSLRNPLALYIDYDTLTMIFELSSNSINL